MIDPRQPDYTNTPASGRRHRYNYLPGVSEPQTSPAISIVTPYYNAGKTFAETALSVSLQSFQQWEWIIVDDGSDDPESVDVLTTHALRDSRIRVIHSSGRTGPAAARNLGVSGASAAYIAFIDSDDFFEPTALEKWLWYLESHPRAAMVKGFQVGFGAIEYLWREGFHSGAAILEQNLVQTACLIRRDVYTSIGGMDETIRGGMEDWDFWLKCAAAGFWGGTVPEFLDWYRRRPSHHERWTTWDNGERQAAFRLQLRQRYPRLFDGGFPAPVESLAEPYAEIPAEPCFQNLLLRNPRSRRLLILVPHLVVGGSDKFVLDLMSELIPKHGYEVTIASTRGGDHAWRHCFEAHTPDTFTLETFLRPCDYPRFLAWLIRSRGIDSVLVTHSELGYRLLPYLRTQCPWIRCFDYIHIEEPSWKGGGYPALSVAYAQSLDRTAASSRHLRDWISSRGRESAGISVVTTNIDPRQWSRERYDESALRKKWAIPADIPVILFAGRLCAQKQPDVLARTLKRLRERGPEFLCLIAGDGESGPWLRDYLNSQRLACVRMLGYRTNEEIAELLVVSDIFFLPSRHEGIALTLYEAMAMEVVPVGADVGGQTELVTPECGVMITPEGDEAQLYAEALEGLLRDDALRSRMGVAGRRRIVECFQLQQMGDRMAAILCGAVLDGEDTGPRETGVSPLAPAFASTYAREIMEQWRVEALADRLWVERTDPSSVPADQPGANRPGAAFFAIRWAATLRPLFAGRSHAQNRSRLFRILRNKSRREQLLAAFDHDYYRTRYPDVPRPMPLALLHYAFHGYREGRLPAPGFDGGKVLSDHPMARGEAVNPLLWKICAEPTVGHASVTY